MTYDYDTVVYIGRFRPSHLAHIETMKQALQKGKNLLVLCGSANQPRTPKNPWTASEVSEMIMSALPEELRSRVMVMPLRDTTYNDSAWIEQVQRIVSSVTQEGDNISIIGFSKDESSFYLKMFPQWDRIEMDNIDDLNATDIRNALFDCKGDMTNFDLQIGRNLPTAIHDYIKAWTLTPEYDLMCEEHEFTKWHSARWEGSPFPPMFVCVDAVVVCAGHILLIRRRNTPGKNLRAMPGGYLDQGESIADAVIRELTEETGLKIASKSVTEKILKGAIKHINVYDDPKRSARGRIISHTALLDLDSRGELPFIKGEGDDDACRANWVPLNVFKKMEDQMFEDHFHIIQSELGKL